MELAKIKDEFKDYLGSLNTTVSESKSDFDGEAIQNDGQDNLTPNDNEQYELENKNVSLFSYAEELDDFLEKNYKDDIDKSTLETEKITELDFEDGQFIEEENNDTEKLPVVGILNDLFTDEKIKDKLDTDKDGEINKEEANAFIKTIEELDGEKGNISVKDVLTGIKDIEDLEITQETVDNAENEESKKTQSTAPTNVLQNTSASPNLQNYENLSPSYGNLIGSYGSISSGNIPRNSLSTANTYNANPTNALNKQKKTAENEVSALSKAYKDIFTGKNNNVKKAQEKYNSAKNDYEKLLTEEKNLSSEQKRNLKEAIKSVEKAIEEKEKTQIKLMEAENSKIEKMRALEKEKTILAALQESLKNQKNDSKINDLKSQISASENKIAELSSKIKKITDNIDNIKNDLNQKVLEVEKAQDEKNKLEEKLISDNEKISNELKTALKSFNEAAKNLNSVKDEEEKTNKSSLDNKQNELTKINSTLNTNNAEKIKQDNSGINFNLNVQENLTSEQKADLENFKANYEQNKDKYQEVAKQTGMPAQLIAAIHWRESNGDFSTYLHNGEKLGQTTTLEPAGVYFGANQWTEAAVDAIKRQGTDGVNPNDINSILDFAERYNGLGYKDKGIASPYVWAGTTNYSGGKYVADGVFDPNYYDQQLGVAIMMKSIS